MGYGEITDPAQAPLAQAAGYLVRHLATGRTLPTGAQNVMDLWRGFLDSHAGGTFEGLDGVLDDQRAFARFARQVIEDLGYGDQLGDDPDAEEPSATRRRPRRREENPQEAGGDAEEDERRRTTRPRTRRSDQRADPQDMQAALDDADDADLAEELEMRRGRGRPSAARRRRIPRPTRPTRSSSPASTRRSPPRIWPTRPSSSGCAPISTSSSSR